MGSLQVTELHIKVQLKFIMEINRRTKNRRRGSDLISHLPQQDVFLPPTPWGLLDQMAEEAGLLAWYRDWLQSPLLLWVSLRAGSLLCPSGHRPKLGDVLPLELREAYQPVGCHVCARGC